MRKFIYSAVCSIALLSFTLVPTTAKAEGFHVWVFSCGKTMIVPIDAEMELWDAYLYDAFEYLYCGRNNP
jgi:hypothetical protein